MSCTYFKFSVYTLLILTLCHSSLAKYSHYLDPNNNYDNYNGDYFDYDFNPFVCGYMYIFAKYTNTWMGILNSYVDWWNTAKDRDKWRDLGEAFAQQWKHLDTSSEETSDETSEEKPRHAKVMLSAKKLKSEMAEPVPVDSCWFTLNAAGHFQAMDELDEQFKTARESYQSNVGNQMDSQMLEELLQSRGAAPRAIHKFKGDSLQIPAGLNLGGYSLLRLKDSMLFFHRMKLRNSTRFQVNYLHNDLENMALTLRLNLNDLHLEGAYERSATNKDPSVLYYVPSYGKIEILMKNVNYKMEGRLRLMSDRLTIELLISELVINDDILMSYLNTNITATPEYTIKMNKRSLEDFLERLKSDLDMWLKDYFNDFLMYYQLPTKYDHTEIQEYEKKKTIFLNEYVNYAVNTIRQKIYTLGGHTLMMPKFTIFSVPNMVLRIKDGVLRGMESMYRRSVATGKKENKIRTVDVIIGFSKLKVEYKFEAVLPNGSPPLTGLLFLSADELTAHMGITLIKEPESLDLSFDFIRHVKPESLVVEGPANRLIANYKHLLSHHIISLMSNALIHNVKMLNTITRCVPFIYGKEQPLLDDLKEVGRSGSKNTTQLKAKVRRHRRNRRKRSQKTKKNHKPQQN